MISSDKQYVKELKDFYEKFTTRVLSEIDRQTKINEPYDIPNLTITFDGHSVDIDVNAEVFDHVQRLLINEIEEYE